ncbi:MAG: CCA tRNA nucleotidyltransferase [Pseudomonadota bacterium]
MAPLSEIALNPAMADRIQADWLVSAETKRVVDALGVARPGGSRFVGGCVRNSLMGRAVDDIDIATQLTPDQVILALDERGIRAIPTGIDHGTITAVVDHVPFEITTLRRDVETDGRRAVIAYTEDWFEDAQRRDFRLNALYAEPDGTIHDPTGGGLADAATGKVIFIGNADERLREDYLRILRFFRFNAWYGAGLDKDGLNACQRQKDGLKQIAAERIWKELEKLLRAPAPFEAITAMEKAGVLNAILPQATVSQSLERVQSRTSDSMVRLMALLPKDIEIAGSVAAQLKLSNQEAGRLSAWASGAFGEASDNRRLRSDSYVFGKRAVLDWLIVSCGDDVFQPAYTLLENWTVPKLPVRGQDLLELGISGPLIGDQLRAMEQLWIDSDFLMGRDELLNSLER